MDQKLLMGNEAIARGAVEAGLNFAAAYPGTPSSEIVGTLAEWSKADVSKLGFYVEWSVNEKVAMEVAAGAAYAGAYSLVAMKQVGLNVASDPLMSLAYIGVQGALVVVVADDPGPHSSQTEQDTRSFARFAKLPVFDPSSPEEAIAMTRDAFELSHRYGMPVFLRPTTRVCHATAGITYSEIVEYKPGGFVKDSKWVIFPRLSYMRHQWLEEQQQKLAEEFGANRWNVIQPGTKLGIVTGGVAALYAQEAMAILGIQPTILKIGNPYPFPVSVAREFLNQVEEVVVLEELDPVLEDGLMMVSVQMGFRGKIHGKHSGELPRAGEYSARLLTGVLAKILGVTDGVSAQVTQNTAPELPVRPPVLCAGCSHRASFYAVKRATKGRNVIYTGDIGCYTLGNAPPLAMVDTCLCMGAGLTIAQGLLRTEPDRPVIAFIGDSTFFHTGIPGVINAVYNQHPIKMMILDNSTTAMTGHQPHPGIGKSATGDTGTPIDLVAILKACGVQFVETVNPLELKATESMVRRALEFPGVAAVIMRSPCANTFRPTKHFRIDRRRCSDCGLCLRELGCPAFYRDTGDTGDTGESAGIQISPACYGCGLCQQICPKGAICEV